MIGHQQPAVAGGGKWRPGVGSVRPLRILPLFEATVQAFIPPLLMVFTRACEDGSC